MTDVATNEAARVQDERDINILAAVKRKIKTVADDFDVVFTAVVEKRRERQNSEVGFI